MFARRTLSGLGFFIFATCVLGSRAQAITLDDARAIMGAILTQNGITATEADARRGENGAIHLTYDHVRLNLLGHANPRQLALDGVDIILRDTDTAHQVDLNVTLPEHGKMLAEATTDQRDLTMRGTGAYLRWDTEKNLPVSFDGFADFLIGDEPVSRKHWLMNGLVIRWLPEQAQISWQAAEWTGPNREKRGAVKSTSFVLYPGPNGETHLDYAHDGLWLPSLLQPRTVRIKSSSDGLLWSEARPIIQKGVQEMLTGTAPHIVRRRIGNALWNKAAQNGAPVTIDEFYVEGRGLEALGSGEFIAQQAAHYGFTGEFDFDLLGRQKLQDLLGTPENPTLLGALVPFAVNGLASGEPGPNGTTQYASRLMPDGRIVINGVTVYNAQSGS